MAARIAATLARIRQVIAAAAVMKANFSHMSCITLALRFVVNEPSRNSASIAVTAGDLGGGARAEGDRVEIVEVADFAGGAEG